jgi:hypothetical protein
LATASPPPNKYGWRKQKVTVTFSGTDALSGNVVCDPEIVLSTDGAGQVASGRCSDAAGNQSVASATGINLDRSDPNISIMSPTNGAIYSQNELVTADYICADELSGVEICRGDVGSGQPIDTSRKANNARFTVNATDIAGNMKKLTVTYTVK